jgi:hypothetical protein
LRFEFEFDFNIFLFALRFGFISLFPFLFVFFSFINCNKKIIIIIMVVVSLWLCGLARTYAGVLATHERAGHPEAAHVLDAAYVQERHQALVGRSPQQPRRQIRMPRPSPSAPSDLLVEPNLISFSFSSSLCHCRLLLWWLLHQVLDTPKNITPRLWRKLVLAIIGGSLTFSDQIVRAAALSLSLAPFLLASTSALFIRSRLLIAHATRASCCAADHAHISVVWCCRCDRKKMDFRYGIATRRRWSAWRTRSES